MKMYKTYNVFFQRVLPVILIQSKDKNNLSLRDLRFKRDLINKILRKVILMYVSMYVYFYIDLTSGCPVKYFYLKVSFGNFNHSK